jgi:DNA processing protein
MTDLSKDSLATILLCSNLGLNNDQGEENIKPYTLPQWNKLKEKIVYSSLKRPESLFRVSDEELKRELFLNDSELIRLQQLLGRAGQLGIEIEQLANKGIFITTRAEATYPERLKQVLKKQAPPILYYAGNTDILNSKAIAIVGSRDIDEDAMEFTKKLAQKCVAGGMYVVSGGAKGVDSLSQETTLKIGGKVIAVLSDGLSNKIKLRDIREAVIQGNLLLFSAVHPNARFTVYTAMERNKYIYALADYAVVVSSSDNKGGTWAGATENLKNNWTPLWVRQDFNAPVGNDKLLQMGARPLASEVINNENIRFDNWLTQAQPLMQSKPEYKQLSLEAYISNDNTDYYSKHGENLSCDELQTSEGKIDLFEVFWTYLARELSKARTKQELAHLFNVQESQMSIWLQRAINEAKVQRINGTERYILS